MSTFNTPRITTIEQLIPVLGKPFVVIFGSAVSAKLSPKAPMVHEVKSYILELAAEIMNQGARADCVAAEYARKLYTVNGDYQSILETTKFETFFGKLNRYVKENEVDKLISHIYYCKDNEYGPNHSALAYLLEKRICLAAFTTNFDNALELAYPDLKVLDYRNVPTRLPSEKEQPILVKLHGDAVARSSIMTSRQLFGARLQKHFSFLEDLLDGQKVFVVGYSGYGDIDIAPHLRRSKAQFFWCDLHLIGREPFVRENLIQVLCDVSISQGLPSKRVLNPAAKFLQRFVSNSTKFGQGQADNLLIRLAQNYGWSGNFNGENIAWKDGVKTWMQERKPAELTKFVISLLSWHTDWPHMHISYAHVTDRKRSKASIEYGTALTQVKAYETAILYLRKIIAENPERSLSAIEAVTLLGHNFWRLGEFRDALTVLSPVIMPKFWRGLHAKARSQISDAARTYLEVLVELFHRSSSKSSYRYALNFVLPNEVINKILRLENQSIGNEYLLRCVIYELRHVTGQQVSEEEIRDLFNDAFSMEEWPAAAVISRFWLLINWREAIWPWYRTTMKLWRRRKVDLIIQNAASLAYSLCRIGLVYRVLYNHGWIRIRTKSIEKQLRQKQKKWFLELG